MSRAVSLHGLPFLWTEGGSHSLSSLGMCQRVGSMQKRLLLYPCLHLNPVPAYPPRAALLTHRPFHDLIGRRGEGWTTSGQDGTQLCMLGSNRTGYIAQVCWLPAHSVSFIHKHLCCGAGSKLILLHTLTCYTGTLLSCAVSQS